VDYREMGLKDQLPHMAAAEAIELLSRHGNLVKRPFAIGGRVALVGFYADVWGKALL
jgi:arsenate reductase (glutaredoxin)